MTRLRFRISMSLDGFVAGSSQSPDNPLGIGGERLHQWVIPLAAWRAMHGLEGGDINESTPVVVPILLCSGEGLFDGLGDKLHRLELVRTVAAPGVTHLKFTER